MFNILSDHMPLKLEQDLQPNGGHLLTPLIWKQHCSQHQLTSSHGFNAKLLMIAKTQRKLELNNWDLFLNVAQEPILLEVKRLKKTLNSAFQLLSKMFKSEPLCTKVLNSNAQEQTSVLPWTEHQPQNYSTPFNWSL